jgi:nitroreductase
MEVLEAVHRRRAVRSYTRDPVSQRLLEGLVGAAIQAPSAVNAQPWVFTIIRRASLLDRLSDASKAHMMDTLSGGAAARQSRERLSDSAFHVFYHAPALILISARGLDWAVEDSALAAENLMLTACAQGLGTCWIGLAQRFLETSEGKEIIGLPQDVTPVAPIIVGHPAEPTPRVPRNPPEIHWVD